MQLMTMMSVTPTMYNPLFRNKTKQKKMIGEHMYIVEHLFVLGLF